MVPYLLAFRTMLHNEGGSVETVDTPFTGEGSCLPLTALVGLDECVFFHSPPLFDHSRLGGSCNFLDC